MAQRELSEAANRWEHIYNYTWPHVPFDPHTPCEHFAEHHPSVAPTPKTPDMSRARTTHRLGCEAVLFLVGQESSTIICFPIHWGEGAGGPYQGRALRPDSCT